MRQLADARFASTMQGMPGKVRHPGTQTMDTDVGQPYQKTSKSLSLYSLGMICPTIPLRCRQTSPRR